MPAEIDHVVDDLGAANQRIWQAVMQVSQYLAQHQQAALREAEISGTAHAKSLRSTIEGERIASERIYNQALNPEFWNDATSKEAAHVYGLATRFSTVDPQAAMAARTCEREAAQRWNIDLTAPAPAQLAPMAEVRDVMPAVPGESRDWYELRTTAAASAAHVIRDARTVLASEVRPAHYKPRVEEVVGRESLETPTWDSLEAREEWSKRLRASGYTHEEVNAIVTADKGLVKPASELLRDSKPTKKSMETAATSPTRTHALRYPRQK